MQTKRRIYISKKRRKIIELNGLFDGHFIDVRAFFALQFDCLASIFLKGELNTSHVYSYIIDNLQKIIMAVYQHTYFDHTEKEMFFNHNIFVLQGKRMIELVNNYCEILYTCQQHHGAWA